MAKRKKPRVVWIPSTNSNSIGANRTSNFQRFDISVDGAVGDFVTGEIPLVIDDVSDPIPAATPPSLSDIENSGYRLRRIVGNIWFATVQAAVSTPKSAIVTAGVIVRSVDPTLGASNALLADATTANIAPAEIRNIMDPWIWRRSWITTNLLSTEATVINGFQLSGATHNFANQEGSIMTGSFIDARTARIIGPEQRLFLDVTVTLLSPGGAEQNTLDTEILTDLRVLGSMRTSAGNRRNAAR